MLLLIKWASNSYEGCFVVFDKGCFVVFNKGGGSFEVFNIVPSVPLGAVSFLANKILNGLTFSFLDSILVKEFFYLKAF